MEKILKKLIERHVEKCIENYLQKREVKENEKQDPMKDKLLTDKDVCKLLCISKSTLRRRRDSDGLKATKKGGKWYYRRTDLDRWLS